jgi:hypothetical protein
MDVKYYDLVIVRFTLCICHVRCCTDILYAFFFKIWDGNTVTHPLSANTNKLNDGYQLKPNVSHSSL